MKPMYVYIQVVLLAAMSVGYTEGQSDSKKNMDFSDAKRPNRTRTYSDIARLNLSCAKGLPGAEALEVEKSLATLKEWARLATRETDKILPRFRKNPREFHDSESYFRMLVLATFLSRNIGLKYNPELIAAPTIEELKSTAFYRNSENIFIHGLIKKKLGTCSSLPVLFVSVGRFMGYPLRLVNAKAHLFARWQDKEERFNIEYNGKGLICHADEHYMKWPFEISKDELETGFFLRSLTPDEELATFLEQRAMCLLEHKRTDEAMTAFLEAYSLFPNHPYLKGYINSLGKRSPR
ncbi:MAG: hypothetical protein M0042_07345 [Nitrospiraceae bacterium]|nr:hypothetical protein [Nitrospiraceae bacterium]